MDDTSPVGHALDLSPLATVVANDAAIVQYANASFLELTGYSACDLIGKHASLLGTVSLETRQEMEEAMGAGREWRGEVQLRKSCGCTSLAFATIRPINGRDRAVSHFVAYCEDPSGLNVYGQRPAKGRSKPASRQPGELDGAAAPALTRRQLAVLRLVADGHTDVEISAVLKISSRTVSHHVSHALAKLRAPNRAAAVITAHRLGLLERKTAVGGRRRRSKRDGS